MTTHYSKSEYNYLKAKAVSDGRVLDLELCSDGVMRTKEDKALFEREISGGHANRPPAE